MRNALAAWLRSALMPALTVLASVLVLAVCWGLPQSIMFVLPLASAMLVFLFAVRGDAAMPPWLAFLIGVLTDLLTGGPIGYWALLFVTAHGIGRSLPLGEQSHRLLQLWPGYMLTAAAVGVLGWVVGSAYYMRLIDWRPLVIALVAGGLLFPLLLRLAGYRPRSRISAARR